MEIVLYNNSAESIVVDKSNQLEVYETLTGNFRGEVSVLSPVVQIEHTGLITANYAYIEDFGRYYYITHITSIRTNLWELELSVDVLMTYKSKIDEQTGIIARNQNESNPLLVDDLMMSNNSYTIDLFYQSPGQYDSTQESGWFIPCNLSTTALQNTIRSANIGLFQKTSYMISYLGISAFGSIGDDIWRAPYLDGSNSVIFTNSYGQAEIYGSVFTGSGGSFVSDWILHEEPYQYINSINIVPFDLTSAFFDMDTIEQGTEPTQEEYNKDAYLLEYLSFSKQKQFNFGFFTKNYNTYDKFREDHPAPTFWNRIRILGVDSRSKLRFAFKMPLKNSDGAYVFSSNWLDYRVNKYYIFIPSIGFTEIPLDVCQRFFLDEEFVYLIMDINILNGDVVCHFTNSIIAYDDYFFRSPIVFEDFLIRGNIYTPSNIGSTRINQKLNEHLKENVKSTISLASSLTMSGIKMADLWKNPKYRDMRTTKNPKLKKAGALKQSQLREEVVENSLGSISSGLIQNTENVEVDSTRLESDGEKFLMWNQPYILKKKVDHYYPEGFEKIYGLPLMMTKQLKNVKGFTIVNNIHLERFSTATTDEVDEIEELLKSGVIFPDTVRE